jgi:hypothetical protein
VFDAERQAIARRLEHAVPQSFPAADVDGERILELIDPDPNKLIVVPRPLSNGDRER